MKQTILACFAHPDDEAFGCAGMLAYYARQGAKVVLVCATRGEEGEISDPSLATQETLGQVREAEMRCAAEAIGAHEVIFLDYRDSGMAGTAANERPDAFRNAPAHEVVARLVAIIRRLQPAVVITFEPYGGYGHPDHIAIHHHTVAAFHAAADAGQSPELGAPWQAERLFYTIIRRADLQNMAQAMAEAGAEVEDFSRFIDAIQWPDNEVHVAMDVGAMVDVKWQAILCHRTQVGAGSPFLLIPEARAKELLRTEHLALAWPSPPPDEMWAGLFAER